MSFWYYPRLPLFQHWTCLAVPHSPLHLIHSHLLNRGKRNAILARARPPSSVLIILLTPQQAVTLSRPLLCHLISASSTNTVMTLRTFDRSSHGRSQERAERRSEVDEKGSKMNSPELRK
jgi:hypothetical protein